MCVNSASTVLRGAGDNGANKAKQQARSSRVRQGVNKRLAVIALTVSEKPVYSTFLSELTRPTKFNPPAKFYRYFFLKLPISGQLSALCSLSNLVKEMAKAVSYDGWLSLRHRILDEERKLMVEIKIPARRLG